LGRDFIGSGSKGTVTRERETDESHWQKRVRFTFLKLLQDLNETMDNSNKKYDTPHHVLIISATTTADVNTNNNSDDTLSWCFHKIYHWGAPNDTERRDIYHYLVLTRTTAQRYPDDGG
jgi:hypothetical protein